MPTEKDAHLIENIGCTLERGALTESSTQALARLGMDPNQIYVSEAQLGRDANFGATELRKRWMLLKQMARLQAFEVMHAEHLFLDALGMGRDEIAGHIRKSQAIGRQFGRLSSTPRSRAALHDEAALTAMIANPTEWFSYDAAHDLVDFSPQAKELMREGYSPRLGCPALASTVDCSETKVNLYDVYWDFFAENFAGEYVEKAGEYARLTVSYPND